MVREEFYCLKAVIGLMDCTDAFAVTHIDIRSVFCLDEYTPLRDTWSI